jgi:hypothetical protein
LKLFDKIRFVFNRLVWLKNNIHTFDPNKYEAYTKNKYVKLPATPAHGNQVNYNSDGLIVLNNCECLEEPTFAKAYHESLKVNDWRGPDGKMMDMRWRYYIVCYFANMVKDLEGDFVECGVYKGGYTKAIVEYISFDKLRDKRFYLLDTFEGLVADYASEREKESGLLRIYDHYQSVYEDAVNTFQNIPNVELIKGPVPDTLPQCNPSKVCYLSIDMNMAAPEIAAANYFWDRLTKGAVMILDDYGFYAHKEQKKAFDEFAKQKGVSILQLPTGQGIIFKK